jgi:hypothetical protein
MIKLGRVFVVEAGTTRNLDLSGAHAELVEGSGATATVVRVANISSEDSLGAIAVDGDEILPPWPFIRVTAAGGPVYVGLNYRG